MKRILLIAFIAFSFNTNAQWVQQNSSTANHLMSIHFPTTNIGYSLAVSGYMHKTIDGGANWNMVGIHQDMWGQIFFTSADTGYVTGARGVLKTSNGGVTYSDNFNDSVYITSVYFPTAGIGYAIGPNDMVDSVLTYKTYNGGTTWNKVSAQFCSISTGIQKVYFINTMIGFLVLYGNGIYKTTDGGLTWTEKSTIWDLNDVQFPSPLVGYAVGDMEIAKSIDGGETWNIIASNNPQPLASVFFIDNNTGFASGGSSGGGLIQKTIDGGMNWTVDQASVQTFNCVFFPNANTGYACGSNGIIYKLTTTVGVDDVAAETNNLNISPNPFTEQTTLTFNTDVSAGSTTLRTIKIMDIMGQIVKTEQTTGGSTGSPTRQLTLDMSGNAKGVYFVRIVSTSSTTNVSEANVANRKIVLQ